MRKVILILLIALSFSACHKNDMDPKPTNPNDDKLLVKSVTTTYSDGSYIIDYKYDTKNRLIELNSHITGNADGDVANHVYRYGDQNGLLITSTITRGGTIHVYDYSYTYDGMPSVLTYYQPGKTMDYSVGVAITNNNVSKYTFQTPPGDISTIDYTYANNNKVKEVNKSFSHEGDLVFTLTLDDEYGIKKNPYLYSGNKWVLPDVPFANKNELLKETSINDDQITITTYANTYNQQGYPTTVEVTQTSNSKITKSTITYKYIKAK
jgi:hypothetical protein